MNLAQFKDTYDVIIVGSGGAGCSAALEAWKSSEKVLILTKSGKQISKTANAQGGLQAAIGAGDTPDFHYQDTMNAGNHKSNPKLVRILTESARNTVSWLESIGVSFDREGDGYKLKRAAGISQDRVLSCGDQTGNRVIKPILDAVKKLGIPLLENSGVTELRKSANLFYATVVIGEQKQVLKSRTIIIATGGLLPREKRLGMSNSIGNQMPDGIGLAEQVGAVCKNANLTQYHPTGVITPVDLRRERLPEPMRGAGARILNKNFDEFVDPLTTRNKLTDAIVTQCEQGLGVTTDDGLQGVWLMTPEIDEIKGRGYTEKNYPKFFKLFLDHGHDLTKNPVLVYPIVHYSLGGIQIDEDAQTNIKGLYAAGETTWGVHGEERLMGNSLLDIFVFGRIAGTNAVKAALEYER